MSDKNLHKDSCCFDGEINFEISAGDITRAQLAANTVRSVAYNMLNLSELLFLLVGYIIRSEQDAGLESVELELGSILNNFAVIDWVCSARAQWKQKVSKTDAYASTLNFSSSLIDKVRGGDSMASFASLNSTTLFEPTAKTEENLLELWMAHIGHQQIKQLIEFIPLNFKGVSRADLQTISEIHATTQLLSPRNRMLSLAVYLLETRQLDLLEDWLQLNKASSESSASIDYLEGLCFLNKGQKDSAIESFIAASSCLTEDFFLTYVLKSEADEDLRFLRTSYFLHVMDKFKDYPEQCVQIASLAVDQVDKDDDRVSLLWNKVFLLQLELEDYPEAYTAMTSNPDDERRRECLRKFVLHLSERGDLAPLVEAPYGGLEEEITSILENRAMAVSAKETRYFDLLFAFHITKENYRQAARAMYLQAQQVRKLEDGLNSLNIQEAALLMAINCLKLAKPDNHWVSTSVSTLEMIPKSPKRDHDGNSIISPLSSESQVTTVSQMEKELLIVQAQITLAGRDIESYALEPQEVATLLCKEGLYEDACSLLRSQDLEVTLPVKLLARSYACQISRPEGNELQTQLEELLENEENRKSSTTLYRVASEEILKIGQMLPPIMSENFKNRDMTDYLRLMAKYGELEEAVDTACGILKNATGGIKSKNIDENNGNLPVLIIEKLNYFTKINNADLNSRLKSAMDEYLETLKSLSRSNVQQFQARSVF